MMTDVLEKANSQARKPDLQYYKRHLPHWQPQGATIFLTWRLKGSLPHHVLQYLQPERMRLEREALPADETKDDCLNRINKKLFVLTDRLLDAAEYGPLWLKDPACAATTEQALFYHAGLLYDLWAYVIMANQVHVLLTPHRVNEGKEGQARKPDLTRT